MNSPIWGVKFLANKKPGNGCLFHRYVQKTPPSGAHSFSKNAGLKWHVFHKIYATRRVNVVVCSKLSVFGYAFFMVNFIPTNFKRSHNTNQISISSITGKVSGEWYGIKYLSTKRECERLRIFIYSSITYQIREESICICSHSTHSHVYLVA